MPSAVLNLEPGETWAIKVRGFNHGLIVGEWSEVIIFTTDEDLTPPNDSVYLRLDTANDPLTSDLALEGHLVFGDGDRAIVADPGQNLRLKMGDAAGATNVDFQDASDNIIAHVDSLGKGWFAGMDAGTQQIENVVDPNDDQDAATK